ncbi:hypothetical protein RsoM2USA_11 [Ralstonia phage RsoM2USA]|nr:hypothetical protein RsoM2USA_11 [Ralstonia phage RsoM2USA]
MNEKIVIPEKFYIGYQSRHGVATKLGFATYYEENAACRKRQETINSWSSNVFSKEILDNAPMKGMRISKNVTHGGGWNDTTTWWRIEDPRGFELEISSGNLAKLLGHCNISEGVMSEDCVWGWDKGNGSKVVLLPVNSEIYKAAQASSAVHYAKSMKLADLKLGDYVELKNDTKGIFFGKVTYGYFNYIFPDFGKINLDQTYVIYETEHKRLYFMKTPEVIKAEDAKKPYTEKEAEEYLMNHLVNDGQVTAAGLTDKHSHTLFITYDAKKLIKFDTVLEEISPDVVENRLRTGIRKRLDNKHSASIHGMTGWMSQYYGPKFTPVIAKTNTDSFVVDGIESSDVESYFQPKSKYDYSTGKTVYDPPSGSIVDFQSHKSNHLKMGGHKLLETPDMLNGLQVEKNPQYDPKNKYGYDYRRGIKTQYHRDMIFWFDEVTQFFELKLKFKDWIIDIKDKRSW